MIAVRYLAKTWAFVLSAAYLLRPLPGAAASPNLETRIGRENPFASIQLARTELQSRAKCIKE